MLQRNLLLYKISILGINYVNHSYGFTNGGLVLPTPSSFTSPDVQTLEIVRNAVRIDRGLAIAHANNASRSFRSNNIAARSQQRLPPPPPPPPEFDVDDSQDAMEDTAVHQQVPGFLIDESTQLPTSSSAN
jgi:hypothetical protein